VLDSLLRPVKDRVLDPIARRLASRFHPTTITFAAFILGVGAVATTALGAYLAALLLWLLSRGADGLDGAVARFAGAQSDLGGYLDMLLDVVLYAALPLVVAASTGRAAALVMAAILLAAFYINIVSWSYLSALLEKKRAQHHGSAEGSSVGHSEGHPGGKPRQTSIEMPSGIMEGTETIGFFALFLLFPLWVEYLFGAMAVLTLVSAGQRVAWAVRHLGRRGS
jgi:phosphatidylglycerophosphate synthase